MSNFIKFALKKLKLTKSWSCKNRLNQLFILIAFAGQASVHAPHSMQWPRITAEISVIEIAFTGHAITHVPQRTQSAGSTTYAHTGKGETPLAGAPPLTFSVSGFISLFCLSSIVRKSPIQIIYEWTSILPFGKKAQSLWIIIQKARFHLNMEITIIGRKYTGADRISYLVCRST